MVLLYFVALSATLEQCYSFSSDQLLKHDNFTFQKGSSVILNLSGNVYRKGYYYATVHVGNPPRPYFLNIIISWIQCDAPCTKCLPAPHPLYKPSKDIVKCVDPFCALFRGSGDESIKVACGSPKEQCVTEVITHFSVSQNVIVRDLFHLKLTNGNTVIPRLALGCGFDQEVNGRDHPPYTDGVLGLRNRNTTILAQLHKLGLMQNKFSHCFSAQEGGYLVMGDNIFPSSGIVWAPMFSMSDFYTLGPAELQYDDQATGLEGLLVIFDSGSTYTHISYPAFGALFHMVNKTANQNQLNYVYANETLPSCWKGTKAFNSIRDVKNLFKLLVFNFTNSSNVQLSYLLKRILLSQIVDTCA
ncbi:aspartic proteinase Asp1-like [Apium graveolens]|uniref:aspartic proteinase Asp1-like n=1 Tax=Apium graveolens TaxID=4045 RepID=UPI003D79C59B